MRYVLLGAITIKRIFCDKFYFRVCTSPSTTRQMAHRSDERHACIMQFTWRLRVLHSSDVIYFFCCGTLPSIATKRYISLLFVFESRRRTTAVQIIIIPLTLRELSDSERHSPNPAHSALLRYSRASNATKVLHIFFPSLGLLGRLLRFPFSRLVSGVSAVAIMITQLGTGCRAGHRYVHAMM